MQLRSDALAAHLAKGVRALYTVYGDEPLLVQEGADAIRAAARAAGCSERAVHVVAGPHFDWAALLGSAQALSLFAERRLIEIRIPSGKPGDAGSKTLQRLSETAGSGKTGEGDVTLVVLPKLDRQQQGSAWFTALDSCGVVLRVEPVERRMLPQWIAQRLAAHGLRVASGEDGERALAFFADRVEGNLLAAHHEVVKLALLHPPGELSLAQIEDAVLDVARYDVVKLTEAVLAGQTARALRMLDVLRAEGESAVYVHFMLSADLLALARARAALDAGQPMPMALRGARMWGAKERLAERVLAALVAERIGALVEAAHVCDGIAKGLSHPDWPDEPWAALQRLVLLTLQALPPAVPGRRAVRLALDA